MAGPNEVNGDLLSQVFEQVELAKRILEVKGADPLSWISFLTEFEQQQPQESAQIFQETCHRFTLPGLMSNPDFIALDNPRNTGLLKLGLIVEASEEVNQAKCSTARHFFVVTSSGEERDYYGGSPNALYTSIAKMPSRFALLKDPPRIRLKSGFPVRQESFFCREDDDDPRASAVHKLTYFLLLCHSSASMNVAYEFSRCVFTDQEKYVFAGKTRDKKGFIQVLKSMSESFLVEDDSVSVSDPECTKPSITETEFHEFLASQGLVEDSEDTGVIKHSEMQDVEITRARVLLGDRPQSWTDFLAKLADNQSGSYAETFQDRFFHAAPAGFLYSTDFISRDTTRSIALTKLQFVVVVDNKLGNGQLDKISNHFNIVGTADETKLLGKNTQMLIQTLQKHRDMFHLSTAGSDKRFVSPSTTAVSFEAFFQMESKKRSSMNHKLKYFLNLCGGSCWNSTAYEFARSLLSREEREIFQNQQTSLLEILARESGTFRVTKDEVKLRSRYLWSDELKGDTENEKEQEDQKPQRTEGHQEQDGGEGEARSYTQSGKTNEGLQVKCNKFEFTLNSATPVVPTELKKETKGVEIQRQGSPGAEKEELRAARPLTDHRVMETLRMDGYPMRWTEFKWRFMSNDDEADARIADFQQRWANKVSKTLICFSPDFLALNEVRHRCRLKLQLILAARKRSINPPEIDIDKLQEQFKEIAVSPEVDQTQLNCPSLKEYLVKFAQLFVVQGESVRQNWSALKFPSFFSKEYLGATTSVVHKLQYFQNLCGGLCTTVMACKFLRTHIHPRQEKQLVDSVPKVLKLVMDCQNGVALTQAGEESRREGSTNGAEREKMPSTEAGKPGTSNSLTEQRVFNCLRGMYPMSWTEFKSRFLFKEGQADAAIAKFQREWSDDASYDDRFIVTPDLIAFNMVHHRSTLKLQLILEIRRRSANPSKIPWEELEEQFKEIANRKEIVQAKSGAHFKEYLVKFAPVFAVRGEYVSQSIKSMKFLSFFAEEGNNNAASILHKLNYFKKLCGGHCTALIACTFLQKHIHKAEERKLIDSEEKLMQFVNSSRRGLAIQPMQEGGPQEVGSEGTDIAVVKEVPALGGTQELERILKRMGRPISWQELEGLCPANQSKHGWGRCLEDLRGNYHGTSDSRLFIQGETYVSLNTALHRAFLKLCLLVRLRMRHSNNYPLLEVCEQFKNIGSITERRPFQGGLDVQLQRFPLVFKLSADDSVAPGPQMFTFDEFTTCREHKMANCRHCCFAEFMNICGGKCHYNKAFNFMKMLIRAEEQRELEAAEFVKLMDQCKVNSDLDKTLHSEWTYLTETKEPEKTGGADQSPHPAGNITTPATWTTAPQSTGPSQTGPNTVNSSEKVMVTVQVIGNDQHLAELISAIQSYSQPIIAVGCTESAVVIIDWFGAGFILPIPEGGLSSSEESTSAQWSNLWHMFQDANLVSVMFDCGAVGKFLLEKLDLQLCTVFDVKAAMDLMNSPSAPGSASACNTVSELCHSLGIPGPDQVDHHIVGELSVPGGDGATTLVSRVVRDAAALVPGVYAKLFQKLNDSGVLTQLHELTSSKLHSLYTTRMSGFLPEDVRNVLAAQTAGSDTTTPAPTTGPAQMPAANPMSHHVSTPSMGDRSQSSPMNVANPGQIQTYGNPPLAPFFNSSSNSPQSLSSSSPGSIAQNGINQIANALTRIGSIQPSSNWSTASVGSAHSSLYPLMPSFGLPTWASNYAGNPSNGLHRDTTNPVNQRGVGQHRGSTAAGEGPQFPQAQWMTSHLSQNGTTQSDPMNMQQPAEEDWFSSDLEEELSRIPFEDEKPGELGTGNFGLDAPFTMSNNNVSRLTEELIQYYTEKNKESIVLLLDLLGEDIKTTFTNYVQEHNSRKILTEIVLDVGRNADARFHKSTRSDNPVVVPVSSKPITNKDLELIEENVALTGFDDENRCGIEGTLHSVRGVRNRKKKLIGLTIHIGLPLLGCADMMYDVAQSGKSTLILGYPRVGKTTLLRELARCLSDNEKKRVVVIDTYNEIAGDCDMPHFSIGSARRLQVPEHQPAILLESAKNHSPEVIIIDQIDSREDVEAVTRLSRSRIQIIAGTNRDSVESLINDDILSQIFNISSDGSLSDILSLDSAGALASAKFNPPFEALVEMRETGCWHVHDLKHTFSQLRDGQAYKVQERSRVDEGEVSGGGIGQKILLREKIIQPAM